MKSDFEIAHFGTSFFDKIVSKTQNNFLIKMKLGTNSKRLFLHPKSNFTMCEKKNLQQLQLILKSYDSFLIFLIFRFLGVLPRYGLYARKHQIVEMRGDVTDAGQPTDRTSEDRATQPMEA